MAELTISSDFGFSGENVFITEFVSGEKHIYEYSLNVVGGSLDLTIDHFDVNDNSWDPVTFIKDSTFIVPLVKDHIRHKVKFRLTKSGDTDGAISYTLTCSQKS